MAASGTSFDVNYTTQVQELTTPELDCGLPLGECDILRTILAVTFSITIVVDLLTIACIIILRKYQFFHQRIFCHLLLCNLLDAIVLLSSIAAKSYVYFQNLNGDYEKETARCVAQGFFTQWLDLGQFMWVCVLTLFLFNHLVRGKDTASYEWLYTLICWVVPLSIACLPLTTRDYGQADTPYCWIQNTPSGTVWRFVVFWVPVFGGLVVVLLVFIYMIWRANRDMKLYRGAHDPFAITHKRLVRDYLRPLTAYAACFVFFHLIQFINRIQNAVGDPIVELVGFHMVCLALYGVVLCTLFYITNGRKEFTLQKFKDGFKHHRESLSGRGNQGLIDHYPARAVDTPVQTPEAQRRDVSGQLSLRVSVIENTEDSGIEPGDIRADSIGTISLDSENVQA